ncbi:MAG: HAD family hydrolase [Chloroflexota bacterium]
MTDRWATFDCYGTLIDWNGGIAGALRQLWPTADPQRMLARYHAVEPLIQEEISLPYKEVLARSVRALAAIGGLPLRAGDEFSLPDSLPSWPVFPEVPAALGELRRRGWRLGVLSNTDPELLEASLRQISVPVDLTITAADAGSYKPAPGHWETFFARTRVDRENHIHVAASLFHDIAPAHDLGIPAVWINRLGESSALPRAAELTDLTHLPDTLDRIL